MDSRKNAYKTEMRNILCNF